MVTWCIVRWTGSSGLGSNSARVIVLCSWARLITLTVLLSTQVYKWMLTNKMLEGNPAIDLQPIKGQYSSTKLQTRSKVVRTFGVVRPFISQVYRIRFIPLKCTTTGRRNLVHNIFFFYSHT